MPPRINGQPADFIGNYRQRLNEEMTAHGETDRSLAAKLADRGFPVPYSGINKTRKGKRQPTMDECYHVAAIFGYDSLDDFMAGQPFLALKRAVSALQQDYIQMNLQLRSHMHERVRDVVELLHDPEVIASADEINPNWRDEWRNGLETDMRFYMRDVITLWGETADRLEESFTGKHMADA